MTLPASEVSRTVSVTSKIDASILIAFAPGNLTYTGAAQDCEAATIDVAPSGNAAWTYVYTPASPTAGLHNGKPLTAGDYDVMAIYEDDGHIGYAYASFTVEKVILTIAGASHTKEFDGTTAATDVILTLEGIAETDKDDITAGTVTAAYTSANAGTKTLEVAAVALTGLAIDNYDVELPAGSLTVDGIVKKPVTITPTAGQSKIYGTADPVFTYTNTTLVGNDVISGALSRISGDDVDTYPFTLGNISAGDNYALILEGGDITFAITQATATEVTTVIEAVTKSAYESREATTTAAIALFAGLPSEVTVNTDADAAQNLPVVWSTSDIYDAKGATYTFTGAIAGNANIAAGSVTAQATVEISPIVASNPLFADTEVATSAETAATASDLGETVLPVDGQITVEGVTIDYTITWNAQTLNRTAAGNNTTFTGTVSYIDVPAWLTLPSSDVSRKVSVIAAPPVTNSPELTPAIPLRAWIRNDMLHVTGLETGEVWSVYTVSGALVYRSVAINDEADISLRARGVYIVQAGERTVRVVFE